MDSTGALALLRGACAELVTSARLNPQARVGAARWIGDAINADFGEFWVIFFALVLRILTKDIKKVTREKQSLEVTKWCQMMPEYIYIYDMDMIDYDML